MDCPEGLVAFRISDSVPLKSVCLRIGSPRPFCQHPAQFTTVTTPERRGAVRVAVTASINVSSLDSPAALNLADLGMGGFSVRSQDPLPVGKVMRFLFAAPTSLWVVSLTARAVYTRPDAGGPSDVPSHQTGFQFINHDSPAVQARIQQLIDHATAAISVS